MVAWYVKCNVASTAAMFHQTFKKYIRPMELWIPLAVLVLAAGFLLAVKAHRRPTEFHYEQARLLTPAEARFAIAMEAALQPGHRLLAKVRVADVITPKAGQHVTAFRKFSQKHLDFVITDQHWTVLAAVELNDKSHDRPERRARDALLRRAFEQAAVPLHFVPVRTQYTPQQLQSLLQPRRP